MFPLIITLAAVGTFYSKHLENLGNVLYFGMNLIELLNAVVP